MGFNSALKGLTASLTDTFCYTCDTVSGWSAREEGARSSSYAVTSHVTLYEGLQ